MPSTTSPLTAVERSLKDSLLVSQFRDVYLYAFSRRTILPDGTLRINHPLPVVAISSILKNTESFSALLSAPEAVQEHACLSEYDYESDSDLDEFEELRVEDLDASPAVPASPASPLAGPASAGGSSSEGNIKDRTEDPANNQATTKGSTLTATKKYLDVPVRNVAYRTLRACVFYLYTGKINFLPLTSSGATDRQALLTASNDFAPPSSPKSIYRFAELYGLTELRDLAYNEIISQLSVKNILEESFSSFFVRHDRLRKHAISYLSRNYSTSCVQQSLPDIMQRIALGEMPHASGVLRSLLGLPVVVSPPSKRRVPRARVVNPVQPVVDQVMSLLTKRLQLSFKLKETFKRDVVHNTSLPSQGVGAGGDDGPGGATPPPAEALDGVAQPTTMHTAPNDQVPPQKKASKMKEKRLKRKKRLQESAQDDQTTSASQTASPSSPDAPWLTWRSSKSLIRSALSVAVVDSIGPPGNGQDGGQEGVGEG